jgi:hypothetical protein
MADLSRAAERVESAREQLAVEAVSELLAILRRAGAGCYAASSQERGTEKIVDVLIEEGWV